MVLEKILKEIEEKKKKHLDIVKIEVDPVEITIHREQYKGLRMAEDIIRKHMNYGWIPVSNDLAPEDGEQVLCTDGEYVYLVEYDADLDAPFGDIDGITAWSPSPEPYRPKQKGQELN
ncbi:MAG TPA: hypothetical protein H9776_05940 [Candidatus Mediterraneibacter intestinipullorum]|nr:hypothetical protein [Candidatus Mediterraneibacter intestinipullorum]